MEKVYNIRKFTFGFGHEEIWKERQMQYAPVGLRFPRTNLIRLNIDLIAISMFDELGTSTILKRIIIKILSHSFNNNIFQ